ncbi:hypothetical protein [Lactiplantibacillus herbarum]|uniref:hypothetical protein n=1 Tax=Lactiplantibacillus herbarum TaxID=1670446 RepID=UPI00064F67E3|nr:hypothetical protein [Lactiplantibacillus herbarum]
MQRLMRLVWRQQAPILIGIVLVFSLIGVLAGSRISHNWHKADDNRTMVTERVTYNRQKQYYVDEGNQRVSSKQAYLQDRLQVYRTNNKGLSYNAHGDYDEENNFYLLVLSLLIGIIMISYPRYRHLNEWLQSMGHQRQTIFQATWLLYGGALLLAGILTMGLTLGTLWLTIPVQYFSHFSMMAWLLKLVTDLLSMLLCMTFAAVIMLITTNAVVVFLLVNACINDAQNEPTTLPLVRHLSQVYKYVTSHGQWELSLLVVLTVSCTVLGYFLSKRQTGERTGQPIIISSWRLPMLVVISLAVTLLMGNVGVNLLATDALVLGYGLIWILALIGLAIWIYRPKWSERLWSLTRQLR